MSNNVTPFVKRMRVQGGTMYTFSSAVEDIGLNINERNNIVKMSNFALLDIPECEAPSNIEQNKFNTFAISGSVKTSVDGDIKDGKIVIAESFQNYALNFESNLLNQPSYNPSLQKTVSEKVFWKWLKETGAIRWQKDISTGYFIEEIDSDTSTGYNSVVKYIGEIGQGSVRTDNFGTYNETYILVPTSHGQTRVYFKQNYDDNYQAGTIYGKGGGTNILGRENYNQPHPDGLGILAQYDIAVDPTDIQINNWDIQCDSSNGNGYENGWWYNNQTLPSLEDNEYVTDAFEAYNFGRNNFKLKYHKNSSGATIEFKRSNIDAIEILYDINELKNIWINETGGIGDQSLSFDKMAIDYATDDRFEFNSVLVYYSVYNQDGSKLLSTNLLGILFLDVAEGSSSGLGGGEIYIPTIEKIQSNGTGFGSSYSFRINIKSDNMFDDTQAVIYDKSTSSQNVLENWTDVFANLEKSLSILNQHTDTVNFISGQYIDMSSIQTQQGNQISSLQYQINDNVQDIKGVNNTVPLFANGDDPLIESSIYMRFGKIGLFENNPQYPVDIKANVKVKDLFLEHGIKDVSVNNVLSYDNNNVIVGSINIAKDFKVYSNHPTPLVSFNYNEAIIESDLTKLKDLSIDGSIKVNNGGITSDGVMTAFDFLISSDLRLKEDVIDINISDTINQVKFKEFYFKNDINKRKRYGVIAQELEKDFPEMVINNDGFKSVSYIDLLIAKYTELEKRIKQLEK